jgi:predicted metal-dependent HD superfamily phosphohydrolase
MTGPYLDQLRKLLINFSVKEESIFRVFEEIIVRYQEPARHYHTLAHIINVLSITAELKHLAEDYPAVQLAAWFHDIIYNPKRSDNEVQSAAFTEQLLANLDVPGETIEKICRMILATAEHLNLDQSLDTAMFLDADLAVLGSDEQTFSNYCQAIRKEYGWVDETLYRTTRLEILKRFLERPRLYYTPILFERLETRARKNLKNEIIRLSIS